MSVRMKVLQGAVGGHDPRVLKGSTPENGIAWKPGDEIVVTDDLAAKFEASGMAKTIVEPKVPVAKTAASASLETSETAVQPSFGRRQRA